MLNASKSYNRQNNDFIKYENYLQLCTNNSTAATQHTASYDWNLQKIRLRW